MPVVDIETDEAVGVMVVAVGVIVVVVGVTVVADALVIVVELVSGAVVDRTELEESTDVEDEEGVVETEMIETEVPAVEPEIVVIVELADTEDDKDELATEAEVEACVRVCVRVRLRNPPYQTVFQRVRIA